MPIRVTSEVLKRKKKKFFLPGVDAFKELLPALPPDKSRLRDLYLTRLEQLLAANVAMGITTKTAALKDYQADIMAIRKAGADFTPQSTYNADLEYLFTMPEYEFVKFIGSVAQNEDLKKNAIAQYQQEQTAIENQRISSRQEAETRMAQFGQQQQESKQTAQLADVKQWNTLMGANQGQDTGVLGAFNMAGLGGGRERWAKAQMASNFEDWRKESLGNLTGSANWIRRWELQHMPNPYQAEEPTPLGEAAGIVSRLESEVERLNSLAELYPIGSAPKGSELDQLLQAIPVAVDDLQKQLGEWQATKQRLLGQPFSDFSAPSTPWQQTPPAPAKLAELVPSFQTGQPIRKGVTVPTPSPQQWNRMLPSEQQMFGGFLNWQGGDNAWQDILAKTQQMLPESIGLGGRGGWSPARQGR